MGSGKNQTEEFIHADKFWFKYILSVFAASIAETVTYPLDITKTRLQIQGELQKSKDVKVKRGMLKTAFGIVKEEGLFKLWQGVTPALYRHVVYTGCRMGAYEQIRNNILKRNADGTMPLWKAVVGGLTAGAFGQFLASPMDLVKVQLQMEGRRQLEGKPPRVHGTVHAFQTIITRSGIRGLWVGWIPNVQRAALVNMGDLATYDMSKNFFTVRLKMEDNYIVHTMASICSGLMAATLGTPADVVKTRMMNQPIDANGCGQLYKSSIDCLAKTVRKEGFFALYKGFIPIWARMAPWSLVFWLTYEQIRKLTGSSSF